MFLFPPVSVFVFLFATVSVFMFLLTFVFATIFLLVQVCESSRVARWPSGWVGCSLLVPTVNASQAGFLKQAEWLPLPPRSASLSHLALSTTSPLTASSSSSSASSSL